MRFTADAPGAWVPGESANTKYPAAQGWFEIDEWGWDCEADTSFTKGTGSAVGKAKPNNFTFSHAFDKSSPALLQKMIRGTHFRAMEVVMLKQTGDSDLVPYFKLTAGAVFVAKVSNKVSDGNPTQDVELVFKGVDIQYKQQTDGGGIANNAMTFQWNVAEMSTETLLSGATWKMAASDITKI